MPQLPQACDDVWPGVHGPAPPHALKVPQRQSAWHMRVCVPQLPQPIDSVIPAVHTPSPEQPLHAPQLQSIPQLRVRLPHRPQASRCVSPGMHEPPPEHMPLAQRQSAPQRSMRVPHVPQLIERVMPEVHSMSASGRHIPPHEVKPGAHSHRPRLHASPPAQGPDSQMPPQPLGSPQRRPIQFGTHASSGGTPLSSATSGPLASDIVASNGIGFAGRPRLVVGITCGVTHTPLSPQVCPFSSQTACRVHGSIVRQRVSGSAQDPRSTTLTKPWVLGVKRKRTSRRRTTPSASASTLAVTTESRADPSRGISTNDEASPSRERRATIDNVCVARGGIVAPNVRSPSRTHTRRSIGPVPGSSVSTSTSTNVAGSTQPPTALAISAAPSVGTRCFVAQNRRATKCHTVYHARLRQHSALQTQPFLRRAGRGTHGATMSDAPSEPAARRSPRAFVAPVIAALRAQPVFAALFAVLALATIVGHWASPIGPGQDYHFHLMSASLNARPSSDPVAALYHPISWFDANTLIYRIAWPFEKVLDPVRAFGLAVLVAFYLGFPTAVAYSLHRSGRPPWAALFAFPFVYCKAWSINGFVPFYSSATFMVLTLGEFDALFERRDAHWRTAAWRGALFAVLLFLAHGHVYAWTTVSLGLFTVIACVRDLSSLRVDGARAAMKRALSTALRSLVTIGPSLTLFALWYMRTHRGAAAAQSNTTLVPVNPSIEQKFLALPAYFIHTRAETEAAFTVGLLLVAFAIALFARRKLGRASWFEAFALLSMASYFALPESINAQTIGPRHVDIAFWTIPLALWASDSRSKREARTTASETGDAEPATAKPPRFWQRPAIEWALILLVFSFSFARIRHITKILGNAYTRELGPIVALAEPCRRARRTPFSTLGYATMTRESNILHSPHFHQTHETLAALCGVETPVYDSTIYPHNLLPLRYRATMPAPVMVIERDPGWYNNALLWQKYDLVLTAEWTPTPDDEARLAQIAELVGTSGTFRLYRRK